MSLGCPIAFVDAHSCAKCERMNGAPGTNPGAPSSPRSLRLRWAGAVRVCRVWESAVALSRDAHLSDDETVAKMGHPDVGHPPPGEHRISW